MPRRRNYWERDVEERTTKLECRGKTRVLRRHLIEKFLSPKLREEEKVAPSMYHRLQEQWFQNAALALEGKRAERRPEHQKIEMRQKDEVLTELMAEHIALEKEFGEL